MAAERDLTLAFRVAIDAAGAKRDLKSLSQAFDDALRRLGKSEGEIALLRQLEREVAQGRRTLASLPEEQRRIVAQMRDAARGLALIDAAPTAAAGRTIREEIARVRDAYVALRRSGVAAGAELAQAKQAAIARVRELGASLSGVDAPLGRARQAIGGLGSALGALGAAIGAGRLVGLADDLARLSGRLAITEGSAQKAAARLGELGALAQRTAIPVGDVADAYARMAGSLRAAGASSEQMLAFQETLALALKVSGASAQESGAVMRQLGQALQRGKLSGDEFVSVAENGGRVLDYLAASLGVSRGRLAEMSQAGELTTDKLLRLSGALGQVRSDAARMPQTVGDALTRVSNAFSQAVAGSTLVRQAVSALASVLEAVARHFDLLAGAALAAGAAFAAIKLGGLVASFGAWAASVVPVVSALVALNPVTLAVGAGVAALTAGLVALSAAASRTPEALAQVGAQAQALRASLEQVGGAVGTTMSALEERIVRAREAATAAAEGLLEATAQRAQAAIALAGEQVAAIEQQAGRARQAIEARYTTEAERMRALAELTRTTEAERVTAVEAGQIKALTLIETAYERIRASAWATAVDIERAESQTLERRQDIWRTLVDTHRGAIDRLLSENARYEADIRRIEEQRLAFNASVEERVRELRRGTMDALAAYQDRLRQVDETTAKARRALLDGDTERAERLGKRAIELALAIGREVTESAGGVTRTVVSAGEAQATAIERVTAAQQLVNEAMTRGQQAARREIERNTEAIAPLEARLAEAREQAEALRQALAERIAARVEVDTTALDDAVRRVKDGLEALKAGAAVRISIEDAQAAIERFRADTKNIPLEMQARAATEAAAESIERFRQEAARAGVQIPAGLDAAPARAELGKLVDAITASEAAVTVKTNADLARQEILGLDGIETASTHTITVRRVEANASGGLVGGALAGLRAGVRTLAAQTLPVARFARGGLVFRRQRSGRVSGTGDLDTEPRLLEAGSYVIRKRSAAAASGLLAQLLRPGLPPVALPSPPGSGTPGQRELPGRGRELPRRELPPGFRGGTEATGSTIERILDELERTEVGRRGGMLEALYDKIIEAEAERARVAGIDPAFTVEMGRKLKRERIGAFRDAVARGDLARAAELSDLIVSLVRELVLTRATGGPVPLPRGDVPALLTPGELIVPREVVARVGLDLLDLLNRAPEAARSLLGGLPRFAEGGPVGGPAAASISNSVSIHAPSAQSARELARLILPELEALMRRRATA